MKPQETSLSYCSFTHLVIFGNKTNESPLDLGSIFMKLFFFPEYLRSKIPGVSSVGALIDLGIEVINVKRE